MAWHTLISERYHHLLARGQHKASAGGLMKKTWLHEILLSKMGYTFEFSWKVLRRTGVKCISWLSTKNAVNIRLSTFWSRPMCLNFWRHYVSGMVVHAVCSLNKKKNKCLISYNLSMAISKHNNLGIFYHISLSQHCIKWACLFCHFSFGVTNCLNADCQELPDTPASWQKLVVDQAQLSRRNQPAARNSPGDFRA